LRGVSVCQSQPEKKAEYHVIGSKQQRWQDSKGAQQTRLLLQSTIASRPKILQNNAKLAVEKNCLQKKICGRKHFVSEKTGF
jgi:hypothetical protein